MDDILGMKGIGEDNPSAGVGFVIIPPNVDRKTYLEDCYASDTVSIAGFDFGHMHNVLVDMDTMQKIKFPNKEGEMGTMVVFVNIPKHNVPMVIGCYKAEKDIFKIHEKKHRFSKSSGDKIVDIDMDANDAKISVSVNGDELTPAIIELIARGNNKNNHIKLDTDGTVLVKSNGRILLLSKEMIEVVLLNGEGVVTANLSMKSIGEERLYYADEFDNEVSVGEKGFEISDKNKNKITISESGITIDSDKNDVKVTAGDSVIEMGDDGINLDSGSSEVTINGNFEALYNKIPGSPIANISQIGVSKKVKIG